MDTKIIMTAEKIYEYHKMQIYFQECSICKAVRKIEEGMSDKTWTYGKDLSQSLKALGNKTTDSTCPNCIDKLGKDGE